jgi:cytochrome c oxidase subunit II
MYPLLADKPATFWFPEQASTFAPEIDTFFFYLLYISIFFFVLIVAAMGYFMVVYRMRKGYKGSVDALHNNTLEIAWTVIPCFIALWIFVRGVYGYLDMMKIPAETKNIDVVAQKWAWNFKYPGGHESDELHVIHGEDTKLTMKSTDVLHSLFVPVFRAKCDIVPGRFTYMWFNPTKTGIFDLFCTEYCGDKHSQMLSKVHVQTQEEFDAWMEKELALQKADPVKWGEKLYAKTKGCATCHSNDGKKIIGPSFLDSWGKDVLLASGETVKFDENYVLESVLNPQAKARKGYETAAQMPSYQGRLKEDEIGALIAYLRTLDSTAAAAQPKP